MLPPFACRLLSAATSKRPIFGLDTDVLPRRSLLVDDNARQRKQLRHCMAFLPTKSLLALDGFSRSWINRSRGWSSDLHFGLLLFRDDRQEATVEWSGSLQDLGQTSYHLGQIAGQLALAYSQVERSGVEIDSLVARIGHLATGLISPSTVAERLGWVLGTRDGSLARPLQNVLSELANSSAPP